ncbi:chitotriosidase-1-like [Panulirus ornatus]|uniref:chitotriosidase-1-like n=1 Tax=Panulirus ornatus TaxID=150431 RepID=UPI003A83DB5D
MWSSLSSGLLLLLLLLAVRVTPQDNTDGDDFVFACYFGSWAVYRPGLGKFDVENIDPFLCTHMIYTFAGLRDNEIVSLDPYNDLYDNYGKGAYVRFTKMKKQNPRLKTLLAIGGWNEGSQKYSQMVATASTRTTFVQSCVQFLQKYGFDGLDMDWEYPTQRGGQPEDRENFALLLDELRTEFDRHGLMLTAAVSAGWTVIGEAYDVDALARNLDFVNLMAYDFHGSWENFAHHHSPLYAHPMDNGTDRYLNVDSAVMIWLDLGLPRDKLVLGMGLYGRTFTLADANQHSIYSTSYQAGQAGPYTRTQGFLGYNEICEMEKREEWHMVRDEHLVSPYVYRNRQWCGYDDVESLTNKTAYLMSLGLAGAMVWSVETDDFHGSCDDGPFPLLNAIRNALENEDLLRRGRHYSQ